jgi:hypothetical protein
MTDLVQPPSMSAAEFAHQRLVIALLQERYPWAGPTLEGIDTFTYTLDAGGYLTWDITRAWLWVKRQLRAGKAAELRLAELPREELARIATTWDITEAFVAGANPEYPGLSAPILDPAQAGAVTSVLIDGVHRAVKAYREGKPFKAIVLPDAVAWDCLLDAPAWASPARQEDAHGPA